MFMRTTCGKAHSKMQSKRPTQRENRRQPKISNEKVKQIDFYRLVYLCLRTTCRGLTPLEIAAT